jgi:uncharacterized protein (TIGR04255 family)
MAESEVYTGPFTPSPPERIQLSNAPLAKVLCQVRWPELTRFTQQFDSIAESIGTALADDYPLFDKRQESNFIFGPDGISAQPGIFVYQWSSANGRWHVHFSHTFVTVEASRYTSKEDLTSRLGTVLAAISKQVSIPNRTRLGYRYLNCVDATEDIEQLIVPGVRGGESVPLRPGAEVVRSVTETLYRVDEDRLQARWAKLPRGTMIDPSISPLPADSWILDLDAYNDDAEPFDANQITESALRLAGRGYAFFRWSVTPKFLEKFGAAK